MSYKLKCALVFFGVIISTYLGLAFIRWDLNPSNWDEPLRFVFIAFGIPFGVLGVIIVRPPQ